MAERKGRRWTGKDYTGHKFWWILVLPDQQENLLTPWGRSYRRVLWQCLHCGNEKVYRLDNLKSWSTVSCWCQRWKHGNQKPPLQTTHWMYGTRPYAIRMNMKRSCDCPGHHSYHRRWAMWLTYDNRRRSFERRWNDNKKEYKDNLYFIRKDLSRWFHRYNCSREHFYPVSKQDLWKCQT